MISRRAYTLDQVSYCSVGGRLYQENCNDKERIDIGVDGGNGGLTREVMEGMED